MRLGVLVALMLMTACGDSARILDADGVKRVAFCTGAWIKCVHDACPDGYDSIDTGYDGRDQVMRCKPAKKETSCPQ